ncbi:hypothetical protein QMZ05_12110 [Bradyrhizobium sp. INPA03-11B]|uniref:hypothetical protein n=1 Tax=Bradyrhizobium sp. INPA03-11B TaxID=418598 RepID=UPI00338F3DBC
MTRLILATSDLAGTMLRRAGQADIAIGFRPRFVWGALPSRAELASSLERRSAEHHDFGTHWLDVASRKHLAPVGDHSLSLLEFCDRCSSIELWADPRPNDQLVLVWLLDFLRPHRRILSKLVVVQTDVEIVAARGGAGLAQWRLPKLTMTDQRLELASRAWTRIHTAALLRPPGGRPVGHTAAPRGAHRTVRGASRSGNRSWRDRIANAGARR